MQRTLPAWARWIVPAGALAVAGIVAIILLQGPQAAGRRDGPVSDGAQAGGAPQGTAAAGPAAAVQFSFTSLDGRSWTSESLRGKVVFVDFWATWCGPCRAAIPDLAQLSRAFPDDVVVLGVSNEPAETVRAFLSRIDVPYPCIAGKQAQLPREFRGVRSIPTVFVVDRAGRISDVLVGRHTLSQLTTAFRQADALPAPSGG